MSTAGQAVGGLVGGIAGFFTKETYRVMVNPDAPRRAEHLESVTRQGTGAGGTDAAG